MIEKTFLQVELIKNLPSEVKKIFEIFLKEDSDGIRLVGGCVRDMILDLPAKDFDFATKFLPQQTIEILEKNNIHAVPTGIKFGTITAVMNGKHFEITTLRKDNEHDGRHCEPQFIDDYFFDAARRDFTINALYLDNKGLVNDYFNGLEDLQNKKVKFIGEAKQRIEEDFLRILRFFRFSCRYAAELDDEGLQACVANKNGVKFLSADRIRNEIFKTFAAAENTKLLWIFEAIENCGIRAEIFSSKLQIGNLLKLLELEESLQIKASEHLKFAALVFNFTKNDNDFNDKSGKLNNAPKQDLLEILTRLNFSNYEKKYFEFLSKKINEVAQELDYQALRELLVFEKKDFIRDFYLLSLIKEPFENKSVIENLKFIDNFSLPSFPINGDDLMARGINGREVGEVLLKAKKLWIASDFTLTKDELLKI